ncbi:glycosyltransferase family 2 protein [Clostridium intestinale]|uniref:glycosyltransferase family 2 protein n=1 Tax=Clostridium intestinale TaxID=36845 RepID=UPI002DD683F3|nr:glycosyltransferase family 2 protein [Clostridium intestinale]WRY49819.1 glycosyltransferase family 2 protein [Clostridium intestinale]
MYIILVNYKNPKYTIDCINSLNKTTYQNKKILVVDNSSHDDSVTQIKNAIKNIDIICADKNEGWSGGNNIGIKKALDDSAEYVLLLNNDTEVEPDFLEQMVSTFDKYENAGIVGSKIIYYDDPDRIWYAGGRVNWLKFTSEHFGIKEIDRGQFDSDRQVTFITGCNMLIKNDVFKNVGLIPDEYFMYFEDCDYCTKVIDSGYKLIYNPKAKIYHKVSASSGGEDSPFTLMWMTRNIQVFMNKYKNKSPNLIFSKVYRYLAFFKKIFMYKLQKDDERVKAILWGLSEWKVIKKKYN